MIKNKVAGTKLLIRKEEKLENILTIRPTKVTPRKILAEHFKSLKGELPIKGGWGYTKEDACIIDMNDPVVNPNLPFDGVGIEYIFVEKRIYEEMIIFRPEGKKFSEIRWKLTKQSLLHKDGKVYDLLNFNITGFPEKILNELQVELEGPNGYANPHFDLGSFEKKRQKNIVELSRDFWFEITSFFGKQ